MYTLAPSIFAADYMNLAAQLQAMEQADVKCLHIDIMDGNFVPNLAFGPDFVRSVRKSTDMELDVHLMIDEPIRYIDDFAEAGADRITVHLESCNDVKQTLDRIHDRKKEAGIALKPETPLEEVSDEIWDSIQVLQIMTVQPGRRGQHFMKESLPRIRAARKKIGSDQRKVSIEVDGDITVPHLREVLEAGAGIVVVGKALFDGSLTGNIRKYKEAGM